MQLPFPPSKQSYWLKFASAAAYGWTPLCDARNLGPPLTCPAPPESGCMIASSPSPRGIQGPKRAPINHRVDIRTTGAFQIPRCAAAIFGLGHRGPRGAHHHCKGARFSAAMRGRPAAARRACAGHDAASLHARLGLAALLRGAIITLDAWLIQPCGCVPPPNASQRVAMKL